MFAEPTTQFLDLGIFDLEVGRAYTVTVTGNVGNVSLEFQHANDRTNWWPDPNFSGTATASVVEESFRCVSGIYRLDFGGAPTAGTKVTIVEHREHDV